MGAAGSMTVTAKAGPNLTATAVVLTNVTSIAYDFLKNVITIVTNNITREFDLASINSVTTTVTGGQIASVVIA